MLCFWTRVAVWQVRIVWLGRMRNSDQIRVSTTHRISPWLLEFPGKRFLVKRITQSRASQSMCWISAKNVRSMALRESQAVCSFGHIVGFERPIASLLKFAFHQNWHSLLWLDRTSIQPSWLVRMRCCSVHLYRADLVFSSGYFLLLKTMCCRLVHFQGMSWRRCLTEKGKKLKRKFPVRQNKSESDLLTIPVARIICSSVKR